MKILNLCPGSKPNVIVVQKTQQRRLAGTQVAIGGKANTAVISSPFEKVSRAVQGSWKLKKMSHCCCETLRSPGLTSILLYALSNT